MMMSRKAPAGKAVGALFDYFLTAFHVQEEGLQVLPPTKPPEERGEHQREEQPEAQVQLTHQPATNTNVHPRNELKQQFKWLGSGQQAALGQPALGHLGQAYYTQVGGGKSAISALNRV